MHSFEEVQARIREFVFDREFDLVVAIANGGIIPAALLNQRLGLPFELIKLSLRDPDQRPMYESPRLVQPIGFDYAGKRILLVEDRVKTGATLRYAKALLEEQAADVKTFAVNGAADYSLFNEMCFKFPWIL
ncbi:MAG: phosphoribosyltransferase [Rikenellaceae bacterium]|jgi:xanthine phosphoribosyltransferase|nr:phosphoribosyltransferase [Rikenellaceae bacterium]